MCRVSIKKFSDIQGVLETQKKYEKVLDNKWSILQGVGKKLLMAIKIFLLVVSGKMVDRAKGSAKKKR